MRWHSLTPSSASKSAGSKLSAGPTPPRTVCSTPVDRCTVKFSDTSLIDDALYLRFRSAFLHDNKHYFCILIFCNVRISSMTRSKTRFTASAGSGPSLCSRMLR